LKLPGKKKGFFFAITLLVTEYIMFDNYYVFYSIFTCFVTSILIRCRNEICDDSIPFIHLQIELTSCHVIYKLLSHSLLTTANKKCYISTAEYGQLSEQ